MLINHQEMPLSWMIYPSIGSALSSGGSNATSHSKRGEKTEHWWVPTARKPDYINGSTLPWVIKYFSVILRNEIVGSDHVSLAISMGQSEFSLLVHPQPWGSYVLRCLDAKANIDIPKNRREGFQKPALLSNRITYIKPFLDMHGSFCANQRAKYYSWDWTSANCKNIFLACG